MKYTPDFSSRFRILKGGKISLVVSALLVSSSIIGNNAYAADFNITNINLNANIASDGQTVATTEDIAATNNFVAISANTHAANVSINNDVLTTDANYGLVLFSVGNVNAPSTLEIASGKTVSSTKTDNLNGYSIDFVNGINNTTITNSGTISTSFTNVSQMGGSYAASLMFDGDADHVTITNTGTITASLSDSVLNSYGGKVSAIQFYSLTNSVMKDISITNSGTISTTVNNSADAPYDASGQNAFGIKMYAFSNSNSIDASNISITNSGTLSVTANNGNHRLADATGIDIKVKTYLYDSNSYTKINNMSISNSGSMTVSAVGSGNATGINIATDSYYGTNSVLNSTITNAGTITVNGAFSAYGIKINSSSIDNLTITNQATKSISATGYFDTFGIDILNRINNSTITNAGEISATATSDDEYQAGAIWIRDLIGASTILNSGTLIASAEDHMSSAWGIRTGNVYGTSIIENTGTIISVAGLDSYGIQSQRLSANAQIINSGTISVSSQNSFAAGIKVSDMQTDGVNSPSITNSGTIHVNTESGGYATGIVVLHADAEATITNSGTIRATSGGVMNANGEIIGGDMSAGAYSVYSFGNGTLTNTSTGKMYGQIYYGSGTIKNQGTISLPYNSTSTIGEFINQSTGKLEIGLLTDGTTTTHAKLVADDVTFQNGSTIKVNVLDASTNVALLAGTTLNDVVSANNSLTVNGTLNVTDNSALLNFSYVIDGNTIDLVEGASTSIVESTLSGGGAGNAQSAAGALQAIQDGGVPAAMQDYYAALGTLSTDTQVAHAVASTTPQATTAATGANTQIMNGIQGIVEMRQNSVMGNGGMNSGDIALRDQNLWIKPFGSKGTQDNKDGVNGFDVKAYGFGLGYDAEISPKQRLGAAFFYTDATVDVNGMPQKSNVDVYTTLVYGNVPVNTNTDFLYQAGYSWQKTKSERTVLPTYDHAKADYTSTTASLDLKLMQNYKIDNALSIRPLVETTYRYNKTPSYSESGAGAMNLSVEKFTSTQLIAGAGAIVDYKLDKESKLVTELHLGYDFHHDAQSVTASYAGAAGVTFDTNGIDNGGWQYNAGVGYEMSNTLGGELNFMYNYQGQGNSFENHTLSAKYIWKF